MDVALFFMQILMGIFIGWLIWGRTSSKEVAVLQLLLKQEQEKVKGLLEQQGKEISAAKAQLALEFELLSQRLLKENTKEFAESSEAKLSALLSPLKQKMDLFQSNIQEIHKTNTHERLTLKNKIESLMDSSKVLAAETHHLTRALKGDVKKQGTWGELVLQKVLEASGLRQDQEYTLQGEGLALTSEEGRRLQPDVIIHLPDTKKVIIDSKMSYKHYDDYFNASSSLEKQESLQKLVVSIKDHIKSLSEKNYRFAKDLHNPDFVLMFVPVEAMFSLVLEAEPSLFEEAWQKSIIIVSPANLLAILRTVESIWKVERQNRNTQKIAMEGGALYDKFVDFLKDLESIGKSLKQTSDHFDKAFNKLSQGKGNLIKKTEELKRLGLKTKKQIPEEYLEEMVEVELN